MLKKPLLAIALGLAVTAHAQAPASPAKKDLVARILKQQQPGIENVARSLVEQPAVELMGNAASALPARVAKDRQEAVAREIQADVQKYLDEAVPIAQARAVKIAPASIGALLEEKFSEEELKQLAGIIESPVYTRFQRLGDDMHKALADRLVADTRSTIEPKVRALEEKVARRLGVNTAPATGAAPQSGGPRAGAAPAAR